MSLPTRPDMGEFINLTNQLADARSVLTDLEYQFEKTKAHNIKKAMDNKAKTRAIDYVKVIGNDEKDEAYLDGLKKSITSKQREITILYGKIEVWKANKDIYRTDSYHQVTGRVGGSLLDEE